MLQSISNSVRFAQLRESFAEDSEAALRNMKASGDGFELDDVRDYFAQMAAHRKVQGPKPSLLSHTRLP